MSNPILGRVERDAQRGYAGFRDTTSPPQQYQQPGAPAGYGQQGYGQPLPPQPGYGEPGSGPGFGGGGGGGGRALTLDDVMMKTAALFAVVLAVGAVSWTAVAMMPGLSFPLLLLGIVGSLGLGLFIAFRRKPVGAPLAVVYAAFEGVLVGAISVVYQMRFDAPGTPLFESIVTQAVLATLCVFGAMLALYKSGLIKVTKKFRSVVLLMGAAYFVFAMINLVYAWFFSGSPFGIGGTGLLGIGISLFATGLAAVFLLLDFDDIETAVRTGAPDTYAWHLAIGLIVTLVWLYIEMLRLLGRLRAD